MDRTEHLAWAKQRALEYCDRGNFNFAWQSFVSDLNKHDELANHEGILLVNKLIFWHHIKTVEALSHHIKAFN